jgi:hypothetical protein
MASNPIPKILPQLLSLAEDMADGLHEHETALSIKQNTEAALRTDITSARTTESNYGAAKGEKETASNNLRIADSNARTFIKTARVVLAQRFGDTWSQAWEPSGFPNQSTAVPGTQEERMNLCQSLQIYLANNPAHELPALGITAANAGQRFDALSDARAAVNSNNAAAGQKRDFRDGAVEQLRTRMRGLIHELEQLLSAKDPRWDAFGLNAPGAAESPEVPEALVLTSSIAGTVNADWADARRATHYRVYAQIVGVDQDFRQVLTRDESDATLVGLPSSKTIRVQVVATNDSGASQPSETAEIIVA